MPEMELPFDSRYSFNAYHFTDILRLKEVDRIFSEPVVSRSATKLVYQEGEEGYIFIYRFGSIVFFNVGPARQTELIEKIKTIVGIGDFFITTEELLLEVDKNQKNQILFEKASLDAVTLERLDVLALVLAQSTALEYFELKVDDLLRTSGRITWNLKNKGHMRMSEREVNRFIGFCMLAKQDLISSMYLLDKPEEAWNDEILDTLYRDCSEMFELRERYRTIDHKLKMMQDNLSIIADLLKNRRATLLELTIIILILIEVILFVYELWGK